MNVKRHRFFCVWRYIFFVDIFFPVKLLLLVIIVYLTLNFIHVLIIRELYVLRKKVRYDLIILLILARFLYYYFIL